MTPARFSARSRDHARKESRRHDYSMDAEHDLGLEIAHSHLAARQSYETRAWTDNYASVQDPLALLSGDKESRENSPRLGIRNDISRHLYQRHSPRNRSRSLKYGDWPSQGYSRGCR